MDIKKNKKPLIAGIFSVILFLISLFLSLAWNNVSNNNKPIMLYSIVGIVYLSLLILIVYIVFFEIDSNRKEISILKGEFEKLKEVKE